MKALTVRPPWAQAIMLLGKDVENRTWRTDYRGPLAIHASRHVRRADLHEALEWIAGRGLRPPCSGPEAALYRQAQAGRVIGTVELVDCVRDSRSRWAMADHWHWVLANPTPLDEPVPAVGKLGLWNWTPA